MKLSKLVKEILTESDESQLSAAMGSAFKTLGAEFANNEDEIKQDIQNADVSINESLTVISVVGMLLAAPKIVELLAKGLGVLIKAYKKVFKPKQAKSEEEEVDIAKSIIDFTHKWHKQYIKGLKWILKVSGLFDKAGIKGDANQNKAAEMIYYIIIAGLAVYSGVSAVSAFKQALAGSTGDLSLGALETAMAGIKSSEVLTFLTTLGLKVSK